MPKKKQVRQLRIVLDTNPIYTVLSHDLISKEVQELIKSSMQHLDVQISWYLPEIVVEERKYQMVQKAKELLPALAKLENLLGHNLAITEDILESRVYQAIQTSLSTYSLSPIKLNTSKVNWENLIESSVKRLPPFEANSKEKGFRDAIAGECYLQLLEESPRTASKCLVVFVTEDKLLTEAVKTRIPTSNGRVLDGLEELTNLINTLVSEVGEDFVEEFRKKAGALFFSGAENKDTLYYKEKIKEKISVEFEEQLKALPEGADLRKSDGILITTPPQFIKKEGARIFWITKITHKAKIFKAVPEDEDSITPNVAAQGIRITREPKNRLYLPSFLSQGEEIDIGTGQTTFQVNWSTAVGQQRKLIAPRIDSIDFLETTWSKD